MGLVDNGIELGSCELRSVHVIGERKHPTSGANFDNVRAVFVIEAHGVTRLIGAIDDAIERIAFFAEEACTKATSEVTVASRRTESVYGDEHARARNDTVANGIAQPYIEILVGAHIAHGGESSHQGDAGVGAGVQSLLRDSFL